MISLCNILDIVADNVFSLAIECKILLLFVIGSNELLLFFKVVLVVSSLALVLPNGLVWAFMDEDLILITVGNAVNLVWDFNFSVLIVFVSIAGIDIVVIDDFLLWILVLGVYTWVIVVDDDFLVLFILDIGDVERFVMVSDELGAITEFVVIEINLDDDGK